MATYNPSAYADSYTILQKILHVEQWLKDNPQLKVGKSQIDDDGSDPVIEIPKSKVSSPNELSLGDIILVNRVTEQSVIEYVELFQIAAADATSFYGAVIGTLERGPEGATGPQGPVGPQGPKGDKGDTGADGSSIAIKPDAASCVALGDGYIDADGHFQVLTDLDPRTFTDAGQIQGPQGPQGETGPQGPQGATGATGATGAAATVAVGTVTTGAAGTPAAVENVGTPNAAVLNFTIPQGPQGANGVTSFGGATGAITLGKFLQLSSNELQLRLGDGLLEGGLSGANKLSTLAGELTFATSSGTIAQATAAADFALLMTAFLNKADLVINDVIYKCTAISNSDTWLYASVNKQGNKPLTEVITFVLDAVNATIVYTTASVALPIPTSSDNGKVLGVSSGAYALIASPTPSGVSYLTTAPSANNPDGDLKFVVLSSEPATKYSGYLYIITGA